jgi:hypothetical protein
VTRAEKVWVAAFVFWIFALANWLLATAYKGGSISDIWYLILVGVVCILIGVVCIVVALRHWRSR